MFVLEELLLLSIRYFYTALCYCLFISLSPYFFILTLLLYFCLFVNHVNKPIIFVFGAFVYNLKNAISVTFNLSHRNRCWRVAVIPLTLL